MMWPCTFVAALTANRELYVDVCCHDDHVVRSDFTLLSTACPQLN